MAYPAPHVLLNMSGVHFVNERFSMGIRFNNNFFPNDQENQQSLCAIYAEAVRSWWASNAVIGNQAKLDTVKMNVINSQGRYQDSWTNLVEYTTPVASAQTSSYPPQVALAVTLATAKSRGLACRGRIFLPAPVAAYDAVTGRLQAAGATAVGNALVTLINSLNSIEPGRRAIIASNVREGAFEEVTGIEVGRVLDTMRSRRASLQEDRAPFTITAPA